MTWQRGAPTSRAEEEGSQPAMAARPAPGLPASAPCEAPWTTPAGPARLEGWTLGPFTLTRLDSAAASLRRTAPQAARDLLDDWLLCVGTGQVDRILDDGGRVTAPAGVPFAFPIAQAFEALCRAPGSVTMLVPRDSLPECCAALDRAGQPPLDSAAGRLLGGVLLRLAAELPRMRDAERPRAVEALGALLRAAIPGGAAPGRADDAEVLAARLARVKAIIRQHLRSPDLSPEWLCKLTGMSRSQLYRLFEPTGGVRREIQRERLRQAHRAIADPEETRTIHEIGAGIGFEEPTAFSRAFRREFGYAPSALRRPLERPALPTPPALAPDASLRLM